MIQEIINRYLERNKIPEPVTCCCNDKLPTARMPSSDLYCLQCNDCLNGSSYASTKADCVRQWNNNVKWRREYK